MTSRFDSIIVGQGLAGTALAWSLLRLRQRVLVIDPGLKTSASRIAAGLITPVTGRKFTLSWRYEAFFEEAERFYLEVEKETAASFFNRLSHWHLFSSCEQKELFQQRLNHDALLQKYACPTHESLPEALPRYVNAPFGAYEMRQAAQLKVETFLDVSRKHWETQGNYLQDRLDPAEVVASREGIKIPRLQIETQNLIFCRGAEDRFNVWFPQLRFLPAKGEILTVAASEPLQAVIHAGVWLAPGEANEWKIGSTYEWKNLDHESTPAAREEILNRLSKLCPLSMTCVKQQAAIRPALHDQRPIAGRHHQFPGLAILNGLGSKGSLQAPWLAKELAEHLVSGKSLDPEIDLQIKSSILSQ